MKRLTKQQSQWIWFVGLWCGGFVVVLLLAKLIRMILPFA